MCKMCFDLFFMALHSIKIRRDIIKNDKDF